jgi:hypothetical protein
MSIYPDEGVFFLNIGVKLRFDRAEMPRWKCRPTTSSSSRGQIIRTPIKPSRFDCFFFLFFFFIYLTGVVSLLPFTKPGRAVMENSE